jgi:hypothetical protein
MNSRNRATVIVDRACATVVSVTLMSPAVNLVVMKLTKSCSVAESASLCRLKNTPIASLTAVNSAEDGEIVSSSCNYNENTIIARSNNDLSPFAGIVAHTGTQFPTKHDMCTHT